MMLSLPENTTCLDMFCAREVREGRLPITEVLHIENVHLRVSVINELDGWENLLSTFEVVETTDRGSLYNSEWLETRLLQVKCPSTGQKYVLTVPGGVKTVEEALAFVNGTSEIPELES